jgi:hypothetical protein
MNGNIYTYRNRNDNEAIMATCYFGSALLPYTHIIYIYSPSSCAFPLYSQCKYISILHSQHSKEVVLIKPHPPQPPQIKRSSIRPSKPSAIYYCPHIMLESACLIFLIYYCLAYSRPSFSIFARWFSLTASSSGLKCNQWMSNE